MRHGDAPNNAGVSHSDWACNLRVIALERILRNIKAIAHFGEDPSQSQSYSVFGVKSCILAVDSIIGCGFYHIRVELAAASTSTELATARSLTLD